MTEEKNTPKPSQFVKRMNELEDALSKFSADLEQTQQFLESLDAKIEGFQHQRELRMKLDDRIDNQTVNKVIDKVADKVIDNKPSKAFPVNQVVPANSNLATAAEVNASRNTEHKAREQSGPLIRVELTAEQIECEVKDKDKWDCRT